MLSTTLYNDCTNIEIIIGSAIFIRRPCTGSLPILFSFNSSFIYSAPIKIFQMQDISHAEYIANFYAKLIQNSTKISIKLKSYKTISVKQKTKLYYIELPSFLFLLFMTKFSLYKFSYFNKRNNHKCKQHCCRILFYRNLCKLKQICYRFYRNHNCRQEKCNSR